MSISVIPFIARVYSFLYSPSTTSTSIPSDIGLSQQGTQTNILCQRQEQQFRAVSRQGCESYITTATASSSTL